MEWEKREAMPVRKENSIAAGMIGKEKEGFCGVARGRQSTKRKNKQQSEEGRGIAGGPKAPQPQSAPESAMEKRTKKKGKSLRLGEFFLDTTWRRNRRPEKRLKRRIRGKEYEAQEGGGRPRNFATGCEKKKPPSGRGGTRNRPGEKASFPNSGKIKSRESPLPRSTRRESLREPFKSKKKPSMRISFPTKKACPGRKGKKLATRGGSARKEKNRL